MVGAHSVRAAAGSGVPDLSRSAQYGSVGVLDHFNYAGRHAGFPQPCAPSSRTPRMSAMSFPPAAGRALPSRSRWEGSIWANVTNAYVSGDGVQAVVTDYDRPLTQQQVNQLRQQQKELQDKRAAAKLPGTAPRPPRGKPTPAWTAAGREELAEIRDKLALFQKRSANPAIAETITLKITIAPNAEPGERELRLGAPAALSQPLVFCVGQLPEFNKPEPPVATEPPAPTAAKRQCPDKPPRPLNRASSCPAWSMARSCPAAWTVTASRRARGQRLVIAATARELIPYLADAVPGWFQAALSLYDSQGHEVAYADHFRFHPDPVLFYEVPKDGEYVLQIRDSIYRGREDFVYRITAGELPFITGIFPLGGPAGAQTTVQLTGWNLPAATVTQDDRGVAPGVYPISARAGTNVSNRLPFAVDALPECLSRKRTIHRPPPSAVTLPIIINGRIGQPGQWDVFRFHGRAGEEIVAEVIARRLDSPLDSVHPTDRCRRQTTGLQRRLRGQGRRAANPVRGFLFPRQTAGGRRLLPLSGRRATSGRAGIRLPPAPQPAPARLRVARRAVQPQRARRHVRAFDSLCPAPGWVFQRNHAGFERRPAGIHPERQQRAGQ